jgi:trk system potassium uptake protein TrkH
LVHPNSVSGSGRRDRRIRRKGAVIAWVFFMLFALSLTAVTFLLTFAGSTFEDAILLAISTLSTTGPLVQAAAEQPIEILSLSTAGKLILCASMVTGRLETLVIIALLTPDLWRN